MASYVDARPNVIDVAPLGPTDFGAFVTSVLARQRRSADATATIDQNDLRRCMSLASSFLVTDTTTNANIQHGISTWFAGLNRLVDLVVVLHKRNELELETVNSASRACSECWTAAANWRGLDQCRIHVRDIGGKLKKILDTNERTYRGERVYAP